MGSLMSAQAGWLLRTRTAHLLSSSSFILLLSPISPPFLSPPESRPTRLASPLLSSSFSSSVLLLSPSPSSSSSSSSSCFPLLPSSLVLNLSSACCLRLFCQVGGRWGGTKGQNLFMIGGFGIPFGLMMIVFTGAELVTGNFMVFCIHFIHEPNK